MSIEQIRVIALGLIKRADEKILVEKGYDSVKQEIFYRPLGGGIEFGETGAEALQREFIEEIGKEITVTHLIDSIENIFEFEGQPGHQIMLLYNASFTDPADYDVTHFQRLDIKDTQACWISLAEIEQEGAMLHPWQIKKLI
jgi:8-oxo-dGTP pyrophosphatase MutT (NUDIX family)